MSTSGSIVLPDQSKVRRRMLIGTALFLVVFVVGLLIVKWVPYWHKAHVAAATHAIGTSIVTGASAQAPSVGWAAAWGYATSYFKAVWQAIVLALVLGAAIQVLVPNRWLHRLFGQAGYRSTAVAGLFSLTGMM